MGSSVPVAANRVVVQVDELRERAHASGGGGPEPVVAVL